MDSDALKPPSPRALTPHPIIRTAGLTKQFGDFIAVDSLDIDVMPGTIFAFLGANGSGKSTTIRMLIGLLTPTAGEIQVDGIDVLRHPRQVRDHIGYMGQRVSLYQGLSLRENVEFYAGLYDLSGDELERAWGGLRERFSLAQSEHEKTEDLPAGIRQRAGLALSILHQPRVLFLDEPTAGVDVHSRGLFWELIQEEAASGVTVFVTTHFLEEVDYCDWVSFIDAGRLIADSTPEDLRRRYSGGYRIELRVAPAQRERAREELQRLAASVRSLPDGLEAQLPVLDAEAFQRLRRLRKDLPGSDFHLHQATMAEVFERVIAQSEAEAAKSESGAGTRMATGSGVVGAVPS